MALGCQSSLRTVLSCKKLSGRGHAFFQGSPASSGWSLSEYKDSTVDPGGQPRGHAAPEPPEQQLRPSLGLPPSSTPLSAQSCFLFQTLTPGTVLVGLLHSHLPASISEPVPSRQTAAPECWLHGRVLDSQNTASTFEQMYKSHTPGTEGRIRQSVNATPQRTRS